MTNPNAFSFGANENYWARALDPQVQAERRAKKAQEEAEAERQAEQQRDAWQRQAVMSSAGPAILDLVNGYLAQNRPAATGKVQADFLKRLKGSTPDEFRNALEVLKQTGHVHELTSDTQGFMGERTTHLYPLEG
ncbi:hypothetical protein AB0945_18875 [Streptomyces sp. NPDC005474]|uniref:hypothetical protein n=1 Tax=Streptomyces sp. NPDC005474 TaxID=3154878 RepID=UPI003453B8FD